MTVSEPHPYALVIIPPKTEAGSYQWAVCKNGKVVRRSDRNFLSEPKAREHALTEIEKLILGASER